MTPSDTAKNPDAGSADAEPLDQQKAQDLADKVMRDLDSASRYRINSDMGPWRVAVFVLSVALTLFQLYTALFGTRPTLIQGSIHVGGAMGIIFLLYPLHRSLSLSLIHI